MPLNCALKNGYNGEFYVYFNTIKNFFNALGFSNYKNLGSFRRMEEGKQSQPLLILCVSFQFSHFLHSWLQMGCLYDFDSSFSSVDIITTLISQLCFQGA